MCLLFLLKKLKALFGPPNTYSSSPFLLIAEQYVVAWEFTHSSFEGHLGCFQFLIHMKQPSCFIQIFIYRFFGEHKFSFHLGKYLGVELLGLMVSVCLIFFKKKTVFVCFDLICPLYWLGSCKFYVILCSLLKFYYPS